MTFSQLLMIYVELCILDLHNLRLRVQIVLSCHAYATRFLRGHNFSLQCAANLTAELLLLLYIFSLRNIHKTYGFNPAHTSEIN